jgi:hypothetical protein
MVLFSRLMIERYLSVTSKGDSRSSTYHLDLSVAISCC